MQMTSEQLEQLAQLIANKVFEKMTELPAWEPMTPQDFFHHQVDAFGNIKYSNRKDLLAAQLNELSAQREKLLKEEKYELLTELQEIYDKLKKEYDNL